MKIGLHIPDFTWDSGPAGLRQRLGEVARNAEQAGVDRISVMDHVWQIGHLGAPEHEMLEAYTTLGFLAAMTERVRLLTMVTAVVYREPGLLEGGYHPRRAVRRARDAGHRRGLERGRGARARSVLPATGGAV